jgi:hypothetical protein
MPELISPRPWALVGDPNVVGGLTLERIRGLSAA